MGTRSVWPILLALALFAGFGIYWLASTNGEDGPTGGTLDHPEAAPRPALPAAGTPGAGADAPASGAPAAPIGLPQRIVADDRLTTVAGRVVSRSGNPVGDAVVTPFRVGEGLLLRTREDLSPRFTTGDDGRFEFAGLPAGEPLGFAVEHPEFALLEHEPVAVDDGAQVDLGELVLDAGLRLHGRVSDAAGAPLAGARVQLSDLTGTQRGATGGPRETIADDEGRYEFLHLAQRQYGVEASSAGHQSQSTSISLALGGVGGGARHDFSLQAADSFLGGLLLGSDDRPLADVPLRLSRRESGPSSWFLARTSTDRDGRFTFADIAAGSYQIDVESYRCYLPQPVAVQAGEEDVLLRARFALSLHGRLLADGAPPRTFTVEIRPDGRTGAGLLAGVARERSFATPEAFLLTGLRPGSYRLAVRAEGFAAAESSDVILGPDSGHVECVVALQRGGSIAGRLAAPAPGARAELRAPDWDPSLPIEATFPTPPSHGLVAALDEQGRFLLEHVPPGAWTLTLRAPGAPDLHVRAVEVVEGRLSELGTLQPPAGALLMGTVLGGDGLPRAGARVAAHGEQVFVQVQTDAAGGYRLPPLPAGSYELTASPAALWEALRFEAHQSITLGAGEERALLLTLQERPR